MIERVISMRRDGNEEPQFYELIVRYQNMGDGYCQTTIYGAEPSLREVLTAGGMAGPAINELFNNAR